MVRNPEVQKLSPALLAAIADPNKHAKAALAALLSTVFIHAVDAASLALIVPVVHRGLRDRSGDAKKRAGRIVGTMCALINEPKVRDACGDGASSFGLSCQGANALAVRGRTWRRMCRS